MLEKIWRPMLAASFLCVLAVPVEAQNHIGHGIAMHGDMKYGPDARHFEYVNPDAPKGGAMRIAVIGTFDTLNPYIIKGSPAPGGGVETLMTQSQDEAFTEYGLLAESVETPPDRSWVAFTLRKEARWHDGKPVTVEDVIFSLDILKTKGRPAYRLYYADVVKAEKTGERTVKFSFRGNENRELPLILGQLPVLPKHYWESRDFDQTTLEPPLGSGPYKVTSVDSGRSLELELVDNYWGKDLWLNRGRNNFKTIRYEYFRDDTVALEAFKAGQVDFRRENVARNWATAYDVPAVRNGLIKKDTIPHQLPTGMQAFVLNTRKELFQDRRVRQALVHMFDFEWTNKNLFYGFYKRSSSYFSNSELGSSGLPSKEELAILEKFRGRIPDDVFTREFKLPVTDGSGNNREGIREAIRLLKEAGYEIRDRKMVNLKSGQQLAFEILLDNPSFERIALPFKEWLDKIGIAASVRTVDAAQYRRRMDNFDFDVTVDGFGQSQSPGNEQRFFWGSEAATSPGSENTIGIKDKAIDELIELVISAPDRQSLVTRTRALDRVLLSHWYVIPNWHLPAAWVAYWDRYSRPTMVAKYGPLAVDTWWFDPAKDAALSSRRAKGEDK
jgi:microcin C transport system substrate-binding protein